MDEVEVEAVEVGVEAVEVGVVMMAEQMKKLLLIRRVVQDERPRATNKQNKQSKTNKTQR